VIALIALLAAMLLPAISKAKARTQGMACLNNNRQLAAAWLLYADDHNDRLPYNLGGPNRESVAQRTNLNWVNNILDWNTSNSDNTNMATITEASLGPYASRAVAIYRCPSDSVLSAIQRQAGWSGRVRSYSMNAMVGDAGDLSQQGFNLNNPDYVQFFKLSSIPKPANIFVFLDEHPDSINDGYFLNKAYYHEWVDLPASYHNGAATFSFADGHSLLRQWEHARTKRPALPDAARLPLYIPASETDDFNWVLTHMSIGRD
jgi:prepilin-type processing-associated H-X9-DG protein